MNAHFFLAIVLFLLYTIEAQGFYYQKDKYKNSSEVEIINKKKFERTEAGLVYVHVSYSSNSAANGKTEMKAIFFPPIDKFSKLIVPNSAAQFISSKNTDDVEVWLSAWNLNTTKKRYFFESAGEANSGIYVIGSYSAVIKMESGVPVDIQWVDGCQECPCVLSKSSNNCPDAACLDGFCTVSLSECMDTDSTLKVCDLKIYLGWIGTDSLNVPLSSADLLPFNFNLLGLGSNYKTAAGINSSSK